MSRDSGDKTHDDLIALFLAYLPDNASILDVGCCAGNDSLYFQKCGCCVTAIDDVECLCNSASKLLGQPVEQKSLHDIEYVDTFDGIWVSGGFVHIRDSEFEDVLHRLERALKPGGVLYVGMRAGEFVDGDEDDEDKLLRFNRKQAAEAFSSGKKFTVLDNHFRNYSVGGCKDGWIHLILKSRRTHWYGKGS